MRNTNLINARKKQGLTQVDLANKLNVTKSAVSNWESHYAIPPIKRAFKIAEILKEDVNHLFKLNS